MYPRKTSDLVKTYSLDSRIRLETGLNSGSLHLYFLIKKYQYTYNISLRQYSKLMGISLRAVVRLIRPLYALGYIEAECKDLQTSGKPNVISIVKNISLSDYDEDGN